MYNIVFKRSRISINFPKSSDVLSTWRHMRVSVTLENVFMTSLIRAQYSVSLHLSINNDTTFYLLFPLTRKHSGFSFHNVFFYNTLLM